MALPLIDLLELQTELKTQDNLATSDPVYMVQEKRRIWGIDPGYHCDGYEWYSSEMAETVREEDLESHDLEPVESPGLTKVYYRDEWVNSQPFFTRKAADDFIERQRHNLKSPRVYVESGYHNHEWRQVRDYFTSLVFGAQGERGAKPSST